MPQLARYGLCKGSASSTGSVRAGVTKADTHRHRTANEPDGRSGDFSGLGNMCHVLMGQPLIAAAPKLHLEKRVSGLCREKEKS